MAGPKQKHIVVDVFGVELESSAVEQYFTGTWNVWSMNEGKLDVIKQEIAKLNILGLLETSDRTGKWTGKGEFN